MNAHKIECNTCPIRHRAICAKCDSNELSHLEKIKSYRTFKAGEFIYRGGDDLSFVASIVEGTAILMKNFHDGRTHLVGLLLPSDFIGRPERDRIDFDVVAKTDVTLCCFDRNTFRELLTTTPHLTYRLMEMVLDELDAAQDWMVLLGRKTAREKTATFLKILLRRSLDPDVNGKVQPLCLPLTREQIANYLGMTLETFSRQLSHFRQDGVISFLDRRRFTVLDVNALNAATGDFEDNEIVKADNIS